MWERREVQALLLEPGDAVTIHTLKVERWPEWGGWRVWIWYEISAMTPDLAQNERDACRQLAVKLAEAAEQRAILPRGMYRDYTSAHEGYAAGCRAVAAAIEARNRALAQKG